MAALLALTAFAAGAQTRAVVLEPVLNMYSKPSADADVVSQAIYAANVEVLEEREGFAKIRTADDYTGWSPLASLRKGAPYAQTGRAARVESLFAHLYREASVTKHRPVLTVPFETRLEVIGEAKAWAQVRLPDDRPAWVQTGDLAFDERPLTVPELLSLSRRFLGLPYTWGGTSSFGYDCSGFTQMLCRRGGRNIPRDAGPQAHWTGMKKTGKEDLQPGDLLYFGTSLEKITHTGFYLGDGEFIHATTHERPVVQISRLADEHWTKLLVATRRWIQ